MSRPSPARRGNVRAAAIVAALALPALHAAVNAAYAQMRPPAFSPQARLKAEKYRTEDIRGPLSPMLGASDAPVTIVAFSDYYCQYCRALSGTFKQLLEKYPQQVRVVYRHFATSPETESLSQAALCASEQNHFREYHELIFGTRGVGPQSIPELAAALKLDVDALNECVSSGRYQKRVLEDIREGERLRIQATPTVFVNGQRMAGAMSLDTLSARVEEALKKIG